MSFPDTWTGAHSVAAGPMGLAAALPKRAVVPALLSPPRASGRSCSSSSLSVRRSICSKASRCSLFRALTSCLQSITLHSTKLLQLCSLQQNVSVDAEVSCAIPQPMIFCATSMNILPRATIAAEASACSPQFADRPLLPAIGKKGFDLTERPINPCQPAVCTAVMGLTMLACRSFPTKHQVCIGTS